MNLNSNRARVAVSVGLLAVVVGAPAAASWHGLTAAGAEGLGMTGWWACLVPLVFDAGAAYAAVLSLHDTLKGDSPGVNRLLVWAYALGSAGFNWWHASAPGGTAAPIFFAAASISAVILWDRTLRRFRRDELRARGAIDPPAPRFRLARWLVAPQETRRAWCTAVVEGITDPADAVRFARAASIVGSTTTARADDSRPAPRPDPDDAPDGTTARPRVKAEVIRAAIAELPAGTTAPEIAQHCADRHGVDVRPTYVLDVIRRDRRTPKTPEPLRIAG